MGDIIVYVVVLFILALVIYHFYGWTNPSTFSLIFGVFALLIILMIAYGINDYKKRENEMKIIDE